MALILDASKCCFFAHGRRLNIGMSNTDVIVKTEINRWLWSMLGREQLVYDWWHGANRAFDGQTPEQVYQSGAEGRAQVRDYVQGHLQR